MIVALDLMRVLGSLSPLRVVILNHLNWFTCSTLVLLMQCGTTAVLEEQGPSCARCKRIIVYALHL